MCGRTGLLDAALEALTVTNGVLLRSSERITAPLHKESLTSIQQIKGIV